MLVTATTLLIISPFQYENVSRISVVTHIYDGTIPAKMKQINGFRWSPEHKCWHIPYSVESWTALKTLFVDYEIVHENPPLSYSGNGVVKSTHKEERLQPAPTPRSDTGPTNPRPDMLRPGEAIGIRRVPDKEQYLALQWVFGGTHQRTAYQCLTPEPDIECDQDVFMSPWSTRKKK